MKPIESKPTFIPMDDIDKYDTAICQCPLPIYTEEGCYAHIVKPNVRYVCTKCGTEIMLCRGREFDTTVQHLFDQKRGD